MGIQCGSMPLIANTVLSAVTALYSVRFGSNYIRYLNHCKSSRMQQTVVQFDNVTCYNRYILGHHKENHQARPPFDNKSMPRDNQNGRLVVD